MRIALTVAMNNFPLWEMCLRKNMALADDVYVRFDGKNGDPEILRGLESVCEGKLRGVLATQKQWHCPEWREDMLRMLDDAKDKPDIVLCPDEDECYGEGFAEELKLFASMEKRSMMFDYAPMVTEDGRAVNGGVPYPPTPHMKAYKWEPRLSHWPYHGDGKIARIAHPEKVWKATSKMQHYCCFTPGLEKAMKWRSDIPGQRGVKAVTLLGFGPSITVDGVVAVRGEAWSLNNCYDLFPTDVMKHVTRVFEMHQAEKRRLLPSKSGETHFKRLGNLTELGHRVLLLQQDPEIKHSEPYPINEVLSRFNRRYFVGTPPYMIALAMLEGFTHIHMLGFDQADWEHAIQRECTAYWVGRAEGMGITVTGRLTFSDRWKGRMYGYHWGPDLDEFAWRMLWYGHPLEIRYKEKSRVMRGDFCPEIGE